MQTTIANSFDSSVDLNGSHFEVLDEPPSALQFARLSHISRPVLIKGILDSIVLQVLG